MKKSLIFALLLTIICVLCSCNMDAQDGIHSAIASSTKESKTKINAYLGYNDSCHYIWTDTSITRIDTGSSNITFSDISANEAEGAALLSDGSILVEKHDAKVYKYNSSGKEEKELKEGLVCTALMTNGTILGTYDNELKLFDSTGNAISDAITDFKTIRESGEYTLIETTSKYYIYNSSNLVASGDVVNSNYLTSGFQAISESEFYILLKNNYTVYKLSVTDFNLTSEEYVSANYSYGTETFSFTYTSDSTTYIVFKASETFVKITLGDSPKVEAVTSGYASLKQNTVVNILPDASSSDSSKFIVATWANSLWQIDPTSTSDPVNLLD